MSSFALCTQISAMARNLKTAEEKEKTLQEKLETFNSSRKQTTEQLKQAQGKTTTQLCLHEQHLLFNYYTDLSTCE